MPIGYGDPMSLSESAPDKLVIRVIDTETTGTSPDDDVIEVGYTDLVFRGDHMERLPTQATLYGARKPIPPEASAVHHLIDADIAGLPLFGAEAVAALVQGVDCFVAHNASFERQFIKTDIPWICTYKVAMRLHPDAPTHSNQGLRYWFGFPEIDRAFANTAHRAGPDSYVTTFLFEHLLGQAEVADMVVWTEEPILLPTVRFGQNRGKKWSEVPIDFLEWVLNRPADNAFDEDVQHTCRHWIEQHRKAAADAVAAEAQRLKTIGREKGMSDDQLRVIFAYVNSMRLPADDKLIEIERRIIETP